MERREGRAAFRLLRPRRAAESHVRRTQTSATSLRGMDSIARRGSDAVVGRGAWH